MISFLSKKAYIRIEKILGGLANIILVSLDGGIMLDFKLLSILLVFI